MKFINNDISHLSQLIQKEISGTINSDEKKELLNWINQSSMNKELYIKCLNKSEQKHILNILTQVDVNNAWENILLQLDQNKKSSKINYQIIIKIAAACVLAICCLTIISIYLKNDKIKEQDIVTIDYKPAHNKAILKLSNGKEIYLDSTKKEVSIQNNAISYENGQEITSSKNIEFASIETPRGGYYQVSLPDGTIVKLNASSSLTYPLKFIGNKREVSITGEVYFEVKKDKNKVFIVNTPQQKIEVLGTIFNVNTYNDKKIKTSLLKGKVKITPTSIKENLPVVLNPGYQSIIENEDIKIEPTNVNNEFAWIYGKFNFDNKGLREVMSEIERWYDIDVEIAPDVPNIEFFGGTYRNNNLSTILSLLEQSEIKYNLTSQNKLKINKSNMNN